MQRTYYLDDYRHVESLVAGGSSVDGAAREAGIPVGTVRYWVGLDRPPPKMWERSYVGWRPADEAAYCYLLGLYLGDGCIVERAKKAPQLVLTLDALYPGVISEGVDAISRCCRDCHVSRTDRPGCVALLASHPAWIEAFPQHGPGRKHLRSIELRDWQREITHRHPGLLLRGLIHSDGSRCINRFRTKLPSGRVAEYEYVRYFFTNYSADIRGIFCEHCDLLEIRWTQSSFKNISVAHRDSVARLDQFVGPKH
jgi:hypothetical protein